MENIYSSEEIKELKKEFEFLWYLDIYQEVYRIVRKIPKGKVATYKQVAYALGDEKYACRAVGFVLNKNPNPFFIPCHRVVMSNGDIGNYKFGKKLKEYLLKLEGIEIVNGKIKDFKKYLVEKIEGSHILKTFRRFQLKLRKYINLAGINIEEIRYIGGFDCSFIELEEKEIGIGCLVIYDITQNKVVERSVFVDEVIFPYIPTYLAFREYPLFKKCLENTTVIPDVVIIDGNGYLHPFRLGIATFCGILEEIPTIGVAKKLLYGIEKNSYIIDPKNGEKIGITIKWNQKLYISPGNFVNFENCIKIIKKLLRVGVKLPIPQQEAHNYVTYIRNEIKRKRK